MLSPNISVISITGTTEGDTVTLQCVDGLFPALTLVISCNRSGVWNPDPAELVCTSPQGELNSRVAPAVCLGSTTFQPLYIVNYTSHAF